MKLGTIAFSVALALPTTLCAQGDMRLQQSFDSTGVDIAIDSAYEGRQVAIFVSFAGDGWTDLGGGFGLRLQAPVLLAYDRASMLGTYHLRVPVDTQALANMGLKVYLQAVSVDDWNQRPDQGLQIRISDPVEIDFGAAKQPNQNQGSSEPRDPDHEERTDSPDATVDH